MNFWDNYFVQEPEPFEWYFDYDTFKETIQESMKRDGKIIIAGCGNSHMPEDVSNIIC